MEEQINTFLEDQYSKNIIEKNEHHHDQHNQYKYFSAGSIYLSNNHDNLNNHKPETSLMRAVIMQALLDAVNNSKRTEDKISKKDAKEWFDINNKDFLFICHLADWNPNWVLKKGLIAIANGCRWKKERSTSKTKH